MKKGFVFLSFFFISNLLPAQTATIKISSVSFDDRSKFDKTTFSINGLVFKSTDTTTKKIRIKKKGFDECLVIIEKDTLHFLAKFKEHETYEIKAGCCCALFTLEAKKNAKRGSVRFVNNTKQDLVLEVAEANVDTTKSKSTGNYLFANESAMCLFKPASILLAKTEYCDPKFNYEMMKKGNYDSLGKEQNKLVLASTFFHFLHGEKLTASFDEKTKQISLHLDGYYSDEEYKKAFLEF